MSKIKFWSEKGFGFVKMDDGKELFVHISAFKLPIQPRVLPDLTDREIVVKEVGQGKKGLAVLKAELLPLRIKWDTTTWGVVARSVIFEKSSTVDKYYTLSNSERGLLGQPEPAPTFNESLAQDLVNLGCSQEIIAEAREYHQRSYDLWSARETQRLTLENAKAAAAAMRSTLKEGEIVVVLPNHTPRPTQWINTQSFAAFTVAWDSFVASLQITGSNDRYIWAVINKADLPEIRGSYGHSFMGIQFNNDYGLDRKTKHVYVVYVSCGDGAPHRKWDPNYWD